VLATRGERREQVVMRPAILRVKRKQWEPFAFASPSLALIALVIVFPLIYSFYLSLQNFDLSVGADYEYVGAKNYVEALVKDQRFLGSIWTTAIIIAPSLALELLLGLGIALLLSRAVRGRPIITALLAIPAMVSPVMAAMAWRMMFGVKYGAINNLGRQLGILDLYFDWFGSPALAVLSVVLVEVWHNTPFMMLVLLAGIQSIPQELYDAAKADGARPWQSFWSITLPLLTFTMAVGVMIRLIDLTKLFALIFVLTYGGPGSSTETVAFTTYLAGFKDFRMSYAAALSYVIVGGVLALTLLFLWIQRLREARAA
jgi:ABC-type sugar transport system permease subunit